MVLCVTEDYEWRLVCGRGDTVGDFVLRDLRVSPKNVVRHQETGRYLESVDTKEEIRSADVNIRRCVLLILDYKRLVESWRGKSLHSISRVCLQDTNLTKVPLCEQTNIHLSLTQLPGFRAPLHRLLKCRSRQYFLLYFGFFLSGRW